MMFERLEKIHWLIEQLVAPTPTYTSSSEPPAEASAAGKATISNALLQRVEEATKQVQSGGDVELLELFNDFQTSPSNIRVSFANLCLKSLKLLKNELSVSVQRLKELCAAHSQSNCSVGKCHCRRPSPDILSVTQQKHVESLLQFIICFGLSPTLIDGVGIPLGLRSKSFHLITSADLGDLGADDIDVLSKHRHLVAIVNTLLDVSFSWYSTVSPHPVPVLSAMVLSRYLIDILAALLQLSCAPLMKPVDGGCQGQVDGGSCDPSVPLTNPDAANKDGDFLMTVELHKELTNEQNEFKLVLDRVVEKTHRPAVVRDLLLLLGSAESKKVNVASVQTRPSAPKWLKKAISSLLLSKILLNPDNKGILAIVNGIIDNVDSTDWKKCEVIGHIIGNLGGKQVELDRYYSSICSQLLHLLNNTTSNGSSRQSDAARLKGAHLLVICSIVRSLAERSHILSKRFFFDRLFQPLLKCCCSCDALALDVVTCSHLPQSTTVPTELELTTCLINIHRCFVLGTDGFCLFQMKLLPVVFPLLEVYSLVCSGVSQLRKPVGEVLFRFLRFCERQTRLDVLMGWCFGDSVRGAPSMDKRLQFTNGDSGGVALEWRKSDAGDSGLAYFNDDVRCRCLMELLSEVNDVTVMVDFFEKVLSELHVMLSGDSSDGERDSDGALLKDALAGGAKSSKSIEQELLDIDKKIDADIRKLRRNLMVVRLLGMLSEDADLQDAIMKDPTKTLSFVCLTLERGASICFNPRREDLNEDDLESGRPLEGESLLMAMSILHLLLNQLKYQGNPTSDWNRFAKLLPSLGVIAKHHHDERIRKMSSSLELLIKSHGVISDVGDDSSKLNRGKERVEGLTSRLEEALKDVDDPLLPVKGHGLLELGKLVQEKDGDTLKQIDRIFQIFQDNLSHDDSYIYLASIAGVSLLANYKPESVIDILVKRYVDHGCRPTGEGAEAEEEMKVKIGEILMRSIRNLGEMVFKYRDVLLNCFLCVINDKQTSDVIRVSSLSNLAELCQLLRYAIHPILHELFSALQMFLQSNETCLDVKRASVLLMTSIFKGLDTDAFQLLENILPSMYKTLKLTYDTTNQDDVLKLHAQLALEEINRSASKWLFPTVEGGQGGSTGGRQSSLVHLEKKISILDL